MSVNTNVWRNLCETQLKPNVVLLLNEASPTDYANCHVALISIFNLISKQNITLNSLKASPSAVNCCQGNRFHLYELYRHPGPYSQFLEEFGDFISDLITHCDKILVIGDFSIHLNKTFDSLSKPFWHLLIDFGFQCASVPCSLDPKQCHITVGK